MAVTKLESTDGFVVTDFPDAPAAGVVRRARKILQSSATDLARSASYSFASFEIERSGASAGINAEGEATGPALEAFMTELTPEVEAGRLHLHAGKGVTAAELQPLSDSASLSRLAGTDAATAVGVLAAAGWAMGGTLDKVKVAIEQTDAAPAPTGLAEAIADLGGQVVEVDGVDAKPWLIWGADADVILAGTKPGALTHAGTEYIKARAIVPWGPIPVTTKAFAQLHQGGRTKVLPDFVTAAGGLVAGYLDGDDNTVLDAVSAGVLEVLNEVDDHDDGPLLAACYRAEAFMSRWQPKPPFGRPLAA